MNIYRLTVIVNGMSSTTVSSPGFAVVPDAGGETP